MAYSHANSKGNTYYLHANERVTKTGKKTRTFFFARDARDNALDEIPEGYVVAETASGMLVLRKAG